MDFNPRQNANANDIRRLDYQRALGPGHPGPRPLASSQSPGYSSGYQDGFAAALRSLDVNSRGNKRRHRSKARSEKPARIESRPPPNSRLFEDDEPVAPGEHIIAAVEQQLRQSSVLPDEDVRRMRVRAVVEVPRTRTVRVPVTVQEEVTTLQRRPESARVGTDPFTLRPVSVPSAFGRDAGPELGELEPVRRVVDVPCYRLDQIVEMQLLEVEGTQEFCVRPREGGFRLNRVSRIPGRSSSPAVRHVGTEAYRADVQGDELDFIPIECDTDDTDPTVVRSRAPPLEAQFQVESKAACLPHTARVATPTRLRQTTPFLQSQSRMPGSPAPAHPANHEARPVPFLSYWA